MAKPRLFIGSSSEGREQAEHLQAALMEYTDAEVWDQGFYSPSAVGVLEALDRRAGDYEYAVLVLTPDDLQVSRGLDVKAIRDNVLIEIGLFIGRLGRERVFLVTADYKALHLPSDLLGVMIIGFSIPDSGNLRSAVNPAALKIREVIRNRPHRHHVPRPDKGQWPRIFARSDSATFVGVMEQLLPRARRVVLIGMGLNVLQKDPLRQTLMRRAASGDCTLEILLADPDSPAVQTRLVEEELGDVMPPVGRQGLIQRLESLLAESTRLGSPASLRLGVFRHYPTFALLIADADYFVYPYGYATLGNFSPVLHFSRHEGDDAEVIAFLDEQHRLVSSASIDATVVDAARKRGRLDETALFPFALYCIPSQGSPLYRFGADILGYDVRSGQVGRSWDDVGSASTYGFHVTCCDVLYFLTREEVALAIQEVRFLAKQYRPFDLDRLELRAAYPNDTCISIVAQDPTGSLEAIHCELVQSVYRRAAASSYTLDSSLLRARRDSAREELLIKRFRAPYILKEFQPHFTLLAEVPPARSEHLLQQLIEQFDQRVPDRWIRVESLAVMNRSSNGRWHIADEIPLG